MVDKQQVSSAIESEYSHEIPIGDQLTFKKRIYRANARNISRRMYGHSIYGNCFDDYLENKWCHKATMLLDTIKEIIDEFKDAGVDESEIMVGHTMKDD